MSENKDYQIVETLQIVYPPGAYVLLISCTNPEYIRFKQRAALRILSVMRNSSHCDSLS